jgi:hypothetical protein
MTIISDDKYLTDTSSDPDKNTFLKKELNFSGTIVYHDLQGNMTNVVSVNKQAQLYKTASRARFSSKGKLSAAYPDQCTETPIYEVIGVNCYDIGSYYTYCQNVYSVYVGHTICGNGGGSGPGGNGSGGGSGGGPGSNPTPSTPSSRRITNNVNNQCVSAGVDMARNANTKIKNMLNLTFGGSEYTDHDINFYDVTTLPSTTDGATTPRNQYTFDINLNANTLPQRSKEYILSTVYHEVLHAYLFSKYPKDGSGRLIMPDQHETMANNYVSLMTDALKLAYPNISNQEAWALSWGGLQETPFYTSKLSSEERSEIESINNKHRKSASNRLGTYCN